MIKPPLVARIQRKSELLLCREISPTACYQGPLYLLNRFLTYSSNWKFSILVHMVLTQRNVRVPFWGTRNVFLEYWKIAFKTEFPKKKSMLQYSVLRWSTEQSGQHRYLFYIKKNCRAALSIPSLYNTKHSVNIAYIYGTK